MKMFLTTLAVLTVFATPAFAQSFCACDGTGSVLAFANKPAAPSNNKIAVRQSGLELLSPWFRCQARPSIPTVRQPRAAATAATMKCSVLTEGHEGNRAGLASSPSFQDALGMRDAGAGSWTTIAAIVGPK